MFYITSRRNRTIDSSSKSCDFLQNIMQMSRNISARSLSHSFARSSVSSVGKLSSNEFSSRKSRTGKGSCSSNPLNYKNPTTEMNTPFDAIEKTRLRAQNSPILRKTWFRGREKWPNFRGELSFFRSSPPFTKRIRFGSNRIADSYRLYYSSQREKRSVIRR